MCGIQHLKATDENDNPTEGKQQNDKPFIKGGKLVDFALLRIMGKYQVVHYCSQKKRATVSATEDHGFLQAFWIVFNLL